MTFTLCRKKKKNKDKKRKLEDGEDKPDIVGVCLYVYINHTLLFIFNFDIKCVSFLSKTE